jgi:NaMN:DMB phosphoribosyltransferase
MKSEPFKAVDAVGDPMIPAVAGIAAGSSVPVTLAGGTQMMAVCAVLKAAVPEFDFDKLAVATTVFVAEDETSDINHISRQISNVPVFAVDPAFEKSANPGLRSYTTGFVKEGAGAGGAMMAAILKGVPVDAIVRKTEDICKDIF